MSDAREALRRAATEIQGPGGAVGDTKNIEDIMSISQSLTILVLKTNLYTGLRHCYALKSQAMFNGHICLLHPS